MAHFAQIDSNNTVIQVIVINNNQILDENGQESEVKGIAYCKALLGGNWIQTSYNGKIRKNYAGFGFTYDSSRDAFIPPKPFESWIVNNDTFQWEPPIKYPNDGLNYYWDEDTTSWIENNRKG